MIKKVIRKKQYDKIKKYIQYEISLHNKCLERLDYAKELENCKLIIESHKAQIVTLNQILRFIENEEAQC